ncbi:MAG: hypothetical protein WCT23_04880 [Candidatus Neomarinimicrobiota bacterium]|jgi:cadmium resistance protein CadD (predicted permease)
MPENKKSHFNKMLAPIVITVFVVAYYLVFVCIISKVPDIPSIIKYFGALLPLAFVGVGIYVLIERIKEIKKGEEDDLSQY